MQVRVSPTISKILDEAATLSVRRGRYYVGVEHLFETLVLGATHLPPSIPSEHVAVLQKVAKVVQGQDWGGVPPSVDGDVFYTPRCADLTMRRPAWPSACIAMRRRAPTSSSLFSPMPIPRRAGSWIPCRSIGKPSSTACAIRWHRPKAR